MVYSHASGSSQEEDFEGRNNFNAPKTRCRGSQGFPSETRFFQPDFSGIEKVRGMETSHRSISSEPVCSMSSLQNGDLRINQTGSSEGRLGYVFGSERRLFSCSDSSQVSTLPSLLLRRESVSIPSSSIWSLSKPLCVHSHIENSTGPYPSSGYSDSCLPGRLVTTFCIRNPVMASQQKASENYSRPRFSSQLGEIRTGSCSELRVSRCSIRPKNRFDRPVTGQDSFLSQDTFQAVRSQTCYSSTAAFHSGSDGIHGQYPTPREGIQEAPSVGTQREMVPETGFMGRQDSVGSLVRQSGRTMDRLGVPNVLVSSPSPHPRSAIVYGCESRGLGRTHGISDGVRILAPRAEMSAYQYSGNESCFACSSGICSPYTGSFCASGDRQHNSVSVYQQAGGLSLVHSVQSFSRNCIMVCQEQGPCQSETFARTSQCLSGLSQQEGEHCSDRMVSKTANSRPDISNLGYPSSGPVCHSPEQEVTIVCITCSGSGGLCNRRPESELEGSVGLCLSPISSHSAVFEEDSERGMLSLSNSTTLGGTSVVSSSIVLDHSPSSISTSEEGSIVSTYVQNVASHAPSVPSSRMAAMQQQMQASGISESVARRIYSAKRPSTNNLYDYRWKSWLDWCGCREVDPFSPTVNDFGEFLISLHDKNFSPATVKGYRSAISTTLKQVSRIDFSNQPILSDVVRSFELERPRTKAHFPKWDLAVVLTTLVSDIFEPLQTCGFKELTFKTVFLTALATGRRRSEIHAFSATDAQFSDGSVSLCTFPGFLAKNQLPSVVSCPISVPSLKGQDVNPLLCPVRALRIYLERVNPRRKGRKRLFISHLDSYEKEISCDSISRWIVQTIKLAYAVNKLELGSVNAHEVRALASSWAWSNRVPLDDVIKAGFWSSENSFIRFYLRETSTMANSLASLGPVVAAQSVVVPVS